MIFDFATADLSAAERYTLVKHGTPAARQVGVDLLASEIFLHSLVALCEIFLSEEEVTEG